MCAHDEVEEVFADFLENNVWAPAETPFVENEHQHNVGPQLSNVMNEDINPKEVVYAARKLKLGKSRKPTGVPNELLKTVILGSVELLILFTQCFNKVFATLKYPYTWLCAWITMIWKNKGSQCDPEMYRPISLFDTISKLYIRILLQRLVDHTKDRIRKSQYAYQKGKSLIDAVYVLLRLAEHLHGVDDQTLHLIFIDFYKCFDKVDSGGLHHALRRIGIHGRLLNALLQFYNELYFEVHGATRNSSRRKQRRGIRQGDPAAAYLFIICSTIMMLDAALALAMDPKAQFDLGRSRCRYRDSTFADDTVLWETLAPLLQRWLHAVETEAERYKWIVSRSKTHHLIFTGGTRYTGSTAQNMKQAVRGAKASITRARNKAVRSGLDPDQEETRIRMIQEAKGIKVDEHTKDERGKAQSKGKPLDVTKNRFNDTPGATFRKLTGKDKNTRIYFKDGTPVQRVAKQKTLGVMVNENLENREELFHRVTKMNASLSQYRQVYRSSRIPEKTRVQVHNAIQEKVLSFAMQLQHYISTDQKKLVSAQVRSLKGALNVPGFYETEGRTISNAEILIQAETTLVSTRARAERLQYLAHVIRRPESPMYWITFNKFGNMKEWQCTTKTKGRRQFWVKEVLTDAMTIVPEGKTLAECAIDHKEWTALIKQNIFTEERYRLEITAQAKAQTMVCINEQVKGWYAQEAQKLAKQALKQEIKDDTKILPHLNRVKELIQIRIEKDRKYDTEWFANQQDQVTELTDMRVRKQKSSQIEMNEATIREVEMELLMDIWEAEDDKCIEGNEINVRTEETHTQDGKWQEQTRTIRSGRLNLSAVGNGSGFSMEEQFTLDDTLRVSEVRENGAASLAGLRVDDEVIALNQVHIKDVTDRQKQVYKKRNILVVKTRRFERPERRAKYVELLKNLMKMSPGLQHKLNLDGPVRIGIDEAGRGSVAGPMVYGACIDQMQNDDALRQKGFRDSKQMTAEERDTAFRVLNESPGQWGWVAVAVSARVISNNMLRSPKYNLNWMAHDATMEIINFVLSSGLTVDALYIDTVGDPGIYQRKLRSCYGERIPQITVEKKADDIYPVVGAASVVAKTIRDEQYKFLTGTESGKGYPSDKKTKRWLEANVDEVFGIHPEVRYSWKTVRDVAKKKGIVDVYVKKNPRVGEQVRNRLGISTVGPGDW